MPEGGEGEGAAAPPAEEAENVAAATPAPAAEPAAESEVADGVAASEADAEGDEGPVPVLWCSGDAPGSTTQHNFEGVWNLDEAEPTINGRPHYNHLTPDKTLVHLFFVENQTEGPNPGRAPRWMVGPMPGNGTNGWAYSDSDAFSPEAVYDKWLAWMKDTSSWGEARLAFKERSANLGNEEEEEEEDGSPAGGAAPKKKKKAAKKGGAKKAGPKKGSKSGRGSARGPKPTSKPPKPPG
jgi:hypothetical protein